MTLCLLLCCVILYFDLRFLICLPFFTSPAFPLAFSRSLAPCFPTCIINSKFLPKCSLTNQNCGLRIPLTNNALHSSSYYYNSNIVYLHALSALVNPPLIATAHAQSTAFRKRPKWFHKNSPASAGDQLPALTLAISPPSLVYNLCNNTNRYVHSDQLTRTNLNNYSDGRYSSASTVLKSKIGRYYYRTKTLRQELLLAI